MGLLFIGGGLGGLRTFTVEAVEALKGCKRVYVDTYTSIWQHEFLEEVKTLSTEVVLAGRSLLEDRMREIVEEAAIHDVGILIPGDPFIATTHTALRELAHRKGVATKILHGVSVLTAFISASGLHVYKFGRTASVPYTDDIEQFRQPLLAVEENLSRGLHTLLLLDTAKGGLTAGEALTKLLEAERVFGRGVIRGDMLVIAVARLGYTDETICADLLDRMMQRQLPPPPHALIIPSHLHFTEKEIVSTYSAPEAVKETVVHNPVRERVFTYTAKCRRIIRLLSSQPRLRDYIKYAEAYVEDAEKFMEVGDLTNALLAAGYAEGLLDALKLRGEVSFEW